MSDVLKSVCKRILRVVIVVFVMMQIIAYTCIDWFMFHPGMVTEKYDESAEGYVNIGTGEEPIAAVILGQERGKKAILRCHGNAESMYQSLWVLRDLIWRGYTVACVDYPGYGLSAGSPTEEGCYRAVHRLYDYLVEKRGFSPKDIIVDGFSIGTGPAVELASTKEVGGLVLEAPFLSAPRVLTRVRLLLNDPFPSARRVYNGIGCPMMIIHGTDDTVIPFAQGERLHQLSCLRPCGYSRRFVPVEGSDHTEIPDALGTTDYLELIAGFAEADNVLKSPVCDDCQTYGSQYEWREHVSPIVAGLVFAFVLAVTLLVLACLRRRRAAKAFRRSCESTMDELQGVRLQRGPKKKQNLDRPIHVEAHTVSLGRGKLVQTGSVLDKGISIT